MKASVRGFADHKVAIVEPQSRGAKRDFLEFPYALYRNDPYWVAPLRVEQKELLDVSRHPFYAHAGMCCFLAIENGRVAGRIAAIIDRDDPAVRHKTASFGFFESIDSQAVADALLSAAGDWLEERGMTAMRGPVSPSINYECGVLIDGFDSVPRIMTAYNPSYYPQLFERAGLRKAHDMYAYRLQPGAQSNIGMLQRAARVFPSGAAIRSVRMSEYREEVDRLCDIYNDAWQENWGAAPMMRDEMHHMGNQLKPILIPELCLFAEAEGREAGFGLVIPDMNQALRHAHGRLFPLGLLKILWYKNKIRSARVLAVGVRKQYRTSALAAELYLALVTNAMRLGYEEAECSWVLEDNRPMIRSLEWMGAERYKSYRIYQGALPRP